MGTTSALLFLCATAALIITTNAVGSHARTSIRGEVRVQDTTTGTTTWTVQDDNAKCSGASETGGAMTVAGVSACQALAEANGHSYISMRPKNVKKFLCHTSASCTAVTGTTLAWQIFHKTVTSSYSEIDVESAAKKACDNAAGTWDATAKSCASSCAELLSSSSVCGGRLEGRSNTRSLAPGTGGAPSNTAPFCYHLNVNEGFNCDDYYSLGPSGKLRLCVADGTGDNPTSDGKCDSTLSCA